MGEVNRKYFYDDDGGKAKSSDTSERKLATLDLEN